MNLDSEAAEAPPAAAAPAGQATWDTVKKKKKRKPLPMDEAGPGQVPPEGGAATAGEQEGKKKKKKKRKIESQTERAGRAPEDGKCGMGADGEVKLSQASALDALLTGTEAAGDGKQQKKLHGAPTAAVMLAFGCPCS